MMMFLTIIMLIVSFVSFAKKGFHNSIKNRYKEIYYVDKNDKLIKKDEVTDEEYNLFIFKVIASFMFILILIFAQLIFFISALSVDIFVIPTVIMILWFVFAAVIGFTKKKGTNKVFMESKPKGSVKRLLMLVYVIYIFVLLLV